MHVSKQEFSQVAAALQLVELEQLVQAHSRRLYNFIRRRIGNLEDLEDITQDTMLEALKCREQFNSQSRPETWLFGIALNLIRSYYKRQRVRDIYDEAEVDDFEMEVGRSPAEIVETNQLIARVSEVFAGLPEDTRMVVHLVFDKQYTYEEAAAHLGIPVGTVRSRISRTRAQLKQMQLLN